MNLRSITGLAAFACLITASCYPLPDPKIKQGPNNTTPPPTLTPEQLKQKQEEEMKIKAEQDLKNQQINNPQLPQGTTNVPKLPPTSDYPFANKIPGKEGFVFSPFNNQPIDVRDIPSGTLVQDPTYPASEKKYFRVP